MYTKQHIEEIAELIANIDDYQERVRTAERFASKFGRDNSRFYEPYFLHACKVRFIDKRTCRDGLTRHDMLARTENESGYFESEEDEAAFIVTYFDNEGNACRWQKSRNPVKPYYWSADFLTAHEIETGKFNGEA